MILEKGKTYTVAARLIGCSDHSFLQDVSVSGNEASGDFVFTSQELLDAVVTMGMPPGIAQNRKSRKQEIAFKMHVIETLLKEDSGSLVRNEEAMKYLDASEKGFLNYYLGMIFTMLAGKKMFHYRYGVHLSLFQKEKRFGKVVFSDVYRPDLIFFAGRRYGVLEAKGRQRESRAVLKEALKQAAAIVSVNAQIPDTYAAVMAVLNTSLRLVVQDPAPAEEKDGIRLDGLTDMSLLAQYYEPLLQLKTELEETDHVIRLAKTDEQVSVRMNLELQEEAQLQEYLAKAEQGVQNGFTERFTQQLLEAPAVSVSFL